MASNEVCEFCGVDLYAPGRPLFYMCCDRRRSAEMARVQADFAERDGLVRFLSMYNIRVKAIWTLEHLRSLAEDLKRLIASGDLKDRHG